MSENVALDWLTKVSIFSHFDILSVNYVLNYLKLESTERLHCFQIEIMRFLFIIYPRIKDFTALLETFLSLCDDLSKRSRLNFLFFFRNVKNLLIFFLFCWTLWSLFFKLSQNIFTTYTFNYAKSLYFL
jgi:hypothetical protein